MLFDLPGFIKKLIEVIDNLLYEIVSLKIKHNDLETKYNDLGSKYNDLEAKHIQLGERNNELEMQVKSNSHNSHKPPSTDLYKTKPAFPRVKGAKKSGGQPQHKGDTLHFSNTPDKVIPLLPNSRCRCGADLSQVEVQIIESRQIFEIPEPKLVVTQYDKVAVCCPHCGERHCGTFPEHVKAHVQYGKGAKTFIVMLNIACHNSIKRISNLFHDLFGYAINDSTIIAASEACYTNLAASEEVIKTSILHAEVVHFDETGVRVAKETQWVHNASTDKATYMFVSKHRGGKAMNSDKSILPKFTGWAIHDCWSPYFVFNGCKHGLCGAHLIRELQALIENGSQWAALVYRFLIDLHHQTKVGPIKEDDFPAVSARYDELCAIADAEEPRPPPKEKKKPGRQKQTKGRNLLDRLKGYKSAVLAFAQYQMVPFTNNQAERDVRPCKTKLKVSTSFRTNHGADIFIRVQGFVSTLRKQNRNVFEYLRASFSPGFIFDV